MKQILLHWKTSCLGTIILGIALYKMWTGELHWNETQAMVYYGAGLLGIFSSDCNIKTQNEH